MRGGGLVAFVLIAGAYIGFEVTMISKAGYRMEASYIYPLLVSARTATVACGDVAPADLAGFDHVLETSRQRLLTERAEAGSAPENAAGEAEDMRRAAEAEMRSQLDSVDCGAPEIRRRLKQFEIYARRAPRITRKADASS